MRRVASYHYATTSVKKTCTTDYRPCALETWDVDCPLLGSELVPRPDLPYDRLDERNLVQGMFDNNIHPCHITEPGLRNVAICLEMLNCIQDPTGGARVRLWDQLYALDPEEPDYDPEDY